MYLDTHAHIFSTFYPDILAVVDQIKKSKVRRVVNIATNLEEAKEVLTLQKQFPELFISAIGLHPEIAESKTMEELESIIDIFLQVISENRSLLSATGEYGLDYSRLPEGKEKATKEKQFFLLENQFQIAANFHLPSIIHCRGALEDLLEFLKRKRVTHCYGVLHSIDGDLNTIKKLIEMGFFVSFNGIMTFKNASQIQFLAKSIPLENILLETDSPFLSPTPLRGTQNSPVNMPYIYAFLADLKAMPVEDIVRIINGNAKKLFKTI